MILDIDVGNSFAKWRLQDAGVIVSRGSQHTQSILEQQKLDFSLNGPLDQVRLSLVARDEIREILRRQFHYDHGVLTSTAEVSQVVASVTCGYRDPRSLGIDRWLAIVAAYTRFKQSLVVIDAGSATTVDIVNSDGHHQGGYILPGVELMRTALWQGTESVKAPSADVTLLDPATCTEDAVNRGSMLALTAAIEQTVSRFSGRLVLTGGDAPSIRKLITLSVHHIPELVIDGLAVNGVSFSQ